MEGAGKPDILFQDNTGRTLGIWEMNNTGYGAWRRPPTPAVGWSVKGIGFFQGS
jgi:hypothetical protein